MRPIDRLMPTTSRPPFKLTSTLRLAGQGLRTWGTKQIRVAIVATVLVGALIGVATVLIPNPIFARDIAPVWWNYPVWLLTSVASGMLVATYVRPASAAADDTTDRRSGRLGMVGGVLAWFAVGCPVCNKIALIALGYAGAITWFAPVQPFLALVAMVLAGVALIGRLRGQVVCTRPTSRTGPAHRESVPHP